MVENENPKTDLSVKIAGLDLKNPVLTASGTFGYGLEFSPLFDLNLLGGIVTKGLSLNPSAGNPPPRIVETPCGMLNAIGLENVGLDAFLAEKLPRLKDFDTVVIANIYGKTLEDYVELARRLNDAEKVEGIEVNISCPNVKAGGVAFGVDPIAAAQVIGAVRRVSTKTIIAKLSPNVTSIAVIARAVEDAGADAVSLINTLTGIAVNIDTRRPVLANVTGGLSGPAIKPVGLRMVWEAARAIKIPVIGIGGIVTAKDALEYLLVGASAVQVGTANFVDPLASVKIVEGIEKFCLEKGIGRITDFIGALEN
ncbi:MAG: dihydroorotate dehydrogenase [Deltaproteobacteria bacterium]|nr:dihydroorotate dehydrogenase [Deltaproteobacteria bacterium]